MDRYVHVFGGVVSSFCQRRVAMGIVSLDVVEGFSVADDVDYWVHGVLVSIDSFEISNQGIFGCGRCGKLKFGMT